MGDDTSPMSPRTYNPEKDIGDIGDMSPVSLLFLYKDIRDNGDMYPMSPLFFVFKEHGRIVDINLYRSLALKCELSI